jgi:hypothetical protein
MSSTNDTHEEREQRRRARNDALMIVGTFLSAIGAIAAAIAAGFSVYAAFRQEKATYTVNVFNRQVDLISSFLLAVTSFGPETIRLKQKILNDGKPLSRDDIAAIKAEIQSAEVGQRQIIAIQTTSMVVLPRSSSLVFRDATSLSDELLVHAREMFEAKTSPDYNPKSTGLFSHKWYSDQFDKDWEKATSANRALRDCATHAFLNGQVISDAEFPDCMRAHTVGVEQERQEQAPD